MNLDTTSDAAIHLTIERLEEGGFLATSSVVPGLIAEGKTIMEAVEIAQDLAHKIAESRIEHGDPLPRALRAISINLASRQFLARS